MAYLMIFDLTTFLSELSKEYKNISVDSMLRIKKSIIENLELMNYDLIETEISKYIRINIFNLKKYHMTKKYLLNIDEKYRNSNLKNIEILKKICINKSYFDYQQLLFLADENNIQDYVNKIHSVFRTEIEEFYHIEKLRITRLKKLKRITKE